MREISLSGRPTSTSYNISALGLRWINIEFMREVQNVYWARNLAGYTRPHTQNSLMAGFEIEKINLSDDQSIYVPWILIHNPSKYWILIEFSRNSLLQLISLLFSCPIRSNRFDKPLDKLEWKNKYGSFLKKNLLRRPIIHRLERRKKIRKENFEPERNLKPKNYVDKNRGLAPPPPRLSREFHPSFHPSSELVERDSSSTSSSC